MKSAAPAAPALFRRLLLIRPGERAPLAWSFAYFFCLLFCYFMLRPIRETMAVTSGAETVPLLFTGTLVVMVLVVPVFGWLVAKLPKPVFLPLVYAFFIANLLIFYLLLSSAAATIWTARAFFVWLSVFNMFAVSVFWSFMADIFTSEQGRRLFGAISAGGSAGALLGPLTAAWLAPQLGPGRQLLLAAVWLALALLCLLKLLRWRRRDPRHRPGHVIGGSIWAGTTALLRSPFLLKIAIVLALFTLLQTIVYNQQIHMVEAAYQGRDPTRFFALVDFGASALSLVLQFLVTPHLLRSVGAAKTLVIMPLFTLIGLVALALYPQVLVLGVFQSLRRGGEYGLMKPARELLYTRVNEEARYKSKNFIDTVVYRGGDATSSWIYHALAQAFGLSMSLISMVAAPVAVLWAWLSLRVGQDFESRSESRPQSGDRGTRERGRDAGV